MSDLHLDRTHLGRFPLVGAAEGAHLGSGSGW